MLSCAHSRGLSLVAAPDYTRQHRGHPPGGAQDRFAAECLRGLLGDPADSPVLECTWRPPELRFAAPALFAITGAPHHAALDGEPIGHARVHRAAAGQVLSWQPAAVGLRTYVGVQGGLRQLPERSDAFAYAAPRDLAALRRRRPPARTSLAWAPAFGRLRVLPGPEWYGELAEQLDGRWRISPDSSAMGLRLRGTRLQRPGGCDILSAPVADGTVQLTAAGPIVLLRQRQTIGGYARILRVIDADVDWAAQLRPGDPVGFDLVDDDEAAAIAAARRAAIAACGESPPATT